MSHTVLLVTAGIELGILVGVGYCEAKRFVYESRLMVLHAVHSLRAPTA